MGENLKQFEHLVVLMMENHSFDNMLGYLYKPEDGKNFEGVSGHTPPLSNPVPSDAEPSPESDGRVTVGKGRNMNDPCPDPGEEYPYINTQIYGGFNPATNQGKKGYKKNSRKSLQSPWNVPGNPPSTPPMTGFVQDYIEAYKRARPGEKPSYDEYRVIMNCFPPEAVPVISTLARSFAVCDHWFCSVPSQTFPNRTFFNAATSNGQVVNHPYLHWLRNHSETIFNRIEECEGQNLSWGIYYDSKDVVPLTLFLHYPKLKKYFHKRGSRRFHKMKDFYKHAREGKLPHYALVQPRLFLDENSEHPPAGKRSGAKALPSSVIAGERLICEVYNAIRESNNPEGSNFKNTVLCITFDEHGGCYDHVPPPAARPPATRPTAKLGVRPRTLGFEFDRLGLRVPTVFVSSWIKSGTVVNTPLQHCSIIKTICNKWGLQSLTDRDLHAPDIRDVFTATEPRSQESWPILTPREEPIKGSNRHSPLSDLQRSIVEMTRLLKESADGLEDIETDALEDIKTVDQALRFIKRSGILEDWDSS